MATRRWDDLAASTRKRYLAKGRSLNQSETQVRQHYESGGNMAAYRGHRHPPGVSEKVWASLKRAAKAAGLDKDSDPPGMAGAENILESLLLKGYKPGWILTKLLEKKDSRDTFRSMIMRMRRRVNRNDDGAYQPGRGRFNKRPKRADIELFYYH